METNEQPQDKQATIENFLKEYGALCQKYGFHVSACGCCESPWLIETSPYEIDGHIEHLRDTLGEMILSD